MVSRNTSRSRSLLLLVVITLLSACAPPLPPSPTPPNISTITFADLPSRQGLYAPLISAFQQQNPDILVQFVPVDNTLVFDRSAPRIASAADTSLIQVSEPAATTVFADLKPLADADTAFDRQDFWPGALDACASNGRSFGLPVLVEPEFLFFDRAAFAAAQQPVPQPGWTWDEFRQTARALTERSGSSTSRYGFVPAVSPLDLLAPQITTAADGSVDPAGLQWYVDLARDGVVPQPDATGASPQGETLIGNRQAAIWSDAAIHLERWQGLLGEQVGLLPFPVPAAGATATTNPVAVSCAALSSGSAHPQAAWRWLSFLSNQLLANDWRSLPARPSVAERDAVWERAPEAERPALRAAMEQARFVRLPLDTAQQLDRAIAQAIVQNAALDPALLQAGSPAAQATTPPVNVAAPQPTPSADIVTISFHTDFRTNSILMQQLAERFNRENPQYRVQLTTVLNQAPGDDQNLASRAARFDCFTTQGLPSPADQELLYDLQPLLDADATLPPGDFDPAQLRLMSQNGRLFGLPFAAQELVVRYNADVLAARSVPTPTVDWSAADFERVIQTAAGGSSDRPLYGFAGHVQVLHFLYAIQGVALYDTSVVPPTARFTEPAAAAATQQLATLANAKAVFDPLNNDSRRVSDLVIGGQVALWLGIAGQQPETSIASDGTVQQPFTIGILPPPATTVPLPQLFPINFYISRRAADPAPCWTWMKFLSRQAEALPGMPVRRSVLDDPATATALGADVVAAYRAIARQPKAVFPFSPWLNNAFTRTVAGDDPTALLSEAQQKMDAFNACLSAAGAATASAEQRQQCYQTVGT